LQLHHWLSTRRYPQLLLTAAWHPQLSTAGAGTQQQIHQPPLLLSIDGTEGRTPDCYTNPALHTKKGKGSPYSITEHRVLELIPVLGSQPAGDASHKPGGRLPLLSTRPAVTPATLKRTAADFAAR